MAEDKIYRVKLDTMFVFSAVAENYVCVLKKDALIMGRKNLMATDNRDMIITQTDANPLNGSEYVLSGILMSGCRFQSSACEVYDLNNSSTQQNSNKTTIDLMNNAYFNRINNIGGNSKFFSSNGKVNTTAGIANVFYGDISNSNDIIRTPEGDVIMNNAINSLNQRKQQQQQSLTKSTISIEEDTSVQVFSSYVSADEYVNNLSNGLKIKDLRSIMGLPHQFLHITDPKIDNTTDVDSIGRVYAEKIIKPMPILFLTPGAPSFMTGYKTEQKNAIIDKFADLISDSDFDSLINERSGKFYTLKYDYVNYFKYVNAMLRSAAFFMGIQDEKINNTKLSGFNWLYDNDKNGDIKTFISTNVFGTYAGAIPFYADVGTDSSDSFSNNTTKSGLSDKINGLSDTAREMNFLMGSSGNVGDLVDNVINSEALDGVVNNLSTAISDIAGDNIFSRGINSFKTVFSGGRMIFPEIWSDSSFSRSYSVRMKLVSPSGDKLSLYLNQLVPLYHLLAFCMPRMGVGQSYYSPFLVRGYYKGMFSIDMGIINNLSVNKGSEGEWSLDGIPTVMELSFDITDLYDGMCMSIGNIGESSIMSNITELDYIANTCGININEPEIPRTIKMFLALGLGTVTDTIELGIFTGITQYINQRINNIFGKF